MNVLRSIIQFETRAYWRSWSLWAGLAVVTALIIFNGIDSWELAPANLALKLTGDALPYIFLLAAFIMLNSIGREKRENFYDIFYALPPKNTTIYMGKLISALLMLNAFLILVGIMVLVIAVSKGSTDKQFWLCGLLVMGETLLAALYGMAVALFISSITHNYRIRYILTLLWLIAINVIWIFAIIEGYPELLGLGLLSVGEKYHFSLAYGLYPCANEIWRHSLTQIALVLLLLVVGRYLYQRLREPKYPLIGKAVALVLTMHLTIIGWNAMHWQQKQAEISANKAYYAKGDNNVFQNWNHIGGKTHLIQDFSAPYVSAFCISSYDITLKLPKTGKNALITVDTVVQPYGQEQLIFTLQRSMRIQSIAYLLKTDIHTLFSSEPTKIDANPWIQMVWQRSGDFFSITLPENVAKQDNVLLEIKYVMEAGESWWGRYGNDLVQFLNNKGIYLNARLGWYPLPGGWRLGIPLGDSRKGNFKVIGVIPYLARPILRGTYQFLPNADFTLRIKAAPDQKVVTNLTKSVNEQDEWKGRADGLSFYMAPMSTYIIPGLVITAPNQALSDTKVVGDAFAALQSFYQDKLGINLPEIRIAVVPGWLNQILLGNVAVLKEGQWAITVRDARRWVTCDHELGKTLDWATRSLHTAIHKALWSGLDAQGDRYTSHPVGKGITQYLDMLWLEQALGSNGSAEYERLLQSYHALASGKFEVDAKLANTPGYKEEESQIAQVILRLHKERQQNGIVGVGRIIRRLMDEVQKGDLTWESWIRLTG